MFKDNLVAVVRCNGKLVVDVGGEVRLPFGSDYTLYFKNKDNRRVVVDVEIDGEDVLDGSSLVIEGNSTLELKGRLDTSKVSNFFRFIEKTKKISNYRGDKIDDGLIKITFRYEINDRGWYLANPQYYFYKTPCEYNYGNSHHYYTGTKSSTNTTFRTATSANFTCSLNDNGITVDGAKTEQNFKNTYTNTLEITPHVMVLSLKGIVEGFTVLNPTFTRDKITCKTCGTKHRLKNKFCSECGSFLRN